MFLIKLINLLLIKTGVCTKSSFVVVVDISLFGLINY
jgi:hypothetical protein